MTAPAYSTDLQTVDLADSLTNWLEIPSRKAGGSQTLEDRAYIQGQYSVSQSTGAATGATCGLQCDYGSNISGWQTGWVFLIWQYWQAPFAIASWANGGMRFGVGSGSGDVDLWNTQGYDYGRNPYGGWANVAVDPTFAYDERVGSPTSGQYRYFWSAPNMTLAVSKGNPHCVDAIRYGRAELKIEFGSSGEGYGTFAGLAAKNDANDGTDGYNRWGLFQAQFGTYLWKGLMSFGNDTNACEFVDANRNIIIDDTPRTYAAFNRIEINNGDSKVYWTSINITPLDPSGLSIGQLEVMDDCDVQFDQCTFTDMGTFIFQASSIVSNCIFRRCGQVTQGSGSFDSCRFAYSPDTVALLADNIAGITNSNFISSGTGYAIEGFDTGGVTYDISTLTFSGYAASDGSTGNEALHVTAVSGIVTINYSGTRPSYDSDGATVSMVSGQVTITIKAAVSLLGAEIRIYDLDTTPPDMGTELQGTESCPSSTYGFTGSSANEIWIQIMLDGYEEFGQQYTMPTANTDFVALLKAELNE